MKKTEYPIGNQRQRDKTNRCADREHTDGGTVSRDADL